MVNFYIPLSKLCLQACPSITSSQKGSNLMSVLKQSSIPNYSGPSAEGEWFADSIVYEPFLVFNGAVMVDYRRISHLSYQAYQEAECKRSLTVQWPVQQFIFFANFVCSFTVFNVRSIKSF